MSTKATNETTKTYKQIELEIRELVTQVRSGKTSIYEIATRCVTLLNASDSYAREIGIKPDDVITHLEAFLADFAVDLESVRTLLEVFPLRQQWNKSLLQLLEEAHTIIRDQQRALHNEDAEHTTRTRSVVKQSEFAELVKQRDDLKKETEHWREEALRLRAENDQLRTKVAELNGEVKALKSITEKAA